jgi:AcrR family transcriptional regulator
MLDAGRRLLAQRGFRGLTLEAVALEAGVSKTSVTSHFGNRVGYMAMLFDSLMHDESLEIGASLRDPPWSSDHAMNWMRRVADLYEDVESSRAYHEIAANAFGDDSLRLRLARVFEWYREMGVQRLSTCEGSAALTAEERERLSALLNAVEDGLALQRGMDPKGFESRPVFELFGYLLQLYFADAAERSR